MSANVCSFCNSPFPSDVPPDHHEAECQLARLETLESVANGSSLYRDKIASNRRLQAELVVVFGSRTHQLRSFLRAIVCDREMEDATTKAIIKLAEMDPSKKSAEDIAADAALIAEVRALKAPVILENQ